MLLRFCLSVERVRAVIPFLPHGGELVFHDQASGANFTSQAMYWVAYDTMEKAAQLLEEADLKETATKMMAAFRSAWPSKEECFFNEVQAGQRYVVNGIATTVRCIR